MQHLERYCLRCTQLPFRFLDLPQNLRDQVYRLCILEPKKHGTPCGTNARFGRHVAALFVYDECRIPSQNPVLLQVNRQIRSKTGQMYYGRHEISLCIDKSHSPDTDTIDPVAEIDKWSQYMVRDLAVHLRALRVKVQWKHGQEDWIEMRVEYSSSHGVQASFDSPARIRDKSLGNGSLDESHVAAVNAKAEAEGHQGEALIRFFTDDSDGFRRACFGAPRGLAGEVDANEERKDLLGEFVSIGTGLDIDSEPCNFPW